MGLIGNEIVQSRVWIDPVKKPDPNLNYKYTFPITVFDAVRLDMHDPDSMTLAEVLERIRDAFDNRQMKLPGLPANNLVTYAGVPGSVGSIQISQKIPWDPVNQRHDRIPTEKAVGEYMYKLGIVDHNGNIIDPEERRYVWTDIVGRPNVYTDLGENDDGFMTQKAVTEHIESLKRAMQSLSGVTGERFEGLFKEVNDHIGDLNNPHHVTAEQIGALRKEIFNAHMKVENPHGITPAMIGLSEVDNTSDEDKPISKATQEALNDLEKLIRSIQEAAVGGIDISGLKYFADARYDQNTGNLQLFYNNGTHINVYIPTNELVADIRYDEETKRIVFTRLSGSKRYLDLSDLSDLVIKYNGSKGDSIVISVDDIEGSNDKVINATIVPKSITREMLADDAVTADLIPEKSITADKLFRGKRDYTILATMRAGEDPRWSRIVGDMIEDESIIERHIADASISTSKLKDLAVTTEKLKDRSVTRDKLVDGVVNNAKVADESLNGSKLVRNPEFIGTPTITKTPDAGANGSQVPDTQWVRRLINGTIIDRDHLADQSVGPSKLFRPTGYNVVLLGTRPSADPHWGKINHEMLEDDSISANNIRNLAITADKLADESILPRHLTRNLISEYNLQESSVTSEKIWTSHSPNMILGVHNADDHPTYTKVNQEMLEQNSVGTLQIQDRNVTLSKLESSKESYRVLTVGLWNTDPKWSQINSKMIEKRAIKPEHLFTSNMKNVVLGIRDAETDPVWMKISGEILEDDSIREVHLQDGSVTGRKIAKDSVDSDHIQEKSILAKHLNDRIIGASHLFSSSDTGVVLAVKGIPNSDPQWSKITTDMIEDFAITPEKMYRSEDPYRVLGVKDPNLPPEYVRLTGDFIEDKSIGTSKLADDLVLRGDVRLANHPPYASNNYSVPTTQWVRRLVTDALGDVSGVTAEIPHDALLPGSPRIEVRPPDDASDLEYNGNMIPDCQWVMDRIKEWYDKIIEMEPEVPEDIWGELIPGGTPGGPAWCGPCVLEEITATYVENSWDNNGAEPDQEDPEDPWDAHCMMKQIGADIVQRIWDTDKVSEDFIDDIIWPEFKMQGNDGRLKITVPDDYEGPTFRLDNGKLRIAGDNDIVDNLHIVDGKLVFTYPENIIYPRFSVDQPIDSLSVELPANYAGPSFYMEDGNLYAEGDIREVQKYSLSDSSVLVDTSYDEKVCRCDTEEVTDEWVKEVWDDEWYKVNSGSGNGNCDCSGGGVSNGSITAIKLAMGAVTTAKLADRAVTGSKLFTSARDHMVLGVKEAGADPEYLKITREMLDDSRLIDGSKLFSSYTPNRILAVLDSGGDPQWVKIKNEFLEDEIIQTRNLADESVTGRKIQDRSIGTNKLADEPMIYPVHITDKAVTEEKIDIDAVRSKHIQKGAVTGEKIEKDAVIPGYPTVEAHTDYERRSLRNTILSPNPPRGGQNGDIWFRYI